MEAVIFKVKEIANLEAILLGLARESDEKNPAVKVIKDSTDPRKYSITIEEGLCSGEYTVYIFGDKIVTQNFHKPLQRFFEDEGIEYEVINKLPPKKTNGGYSRLSQYYKEQREIQRREKERKLELAHIPKYLRFSLN